ncbi:MAG: HAD hydrolase family protein [Lentisphaerae bacterium]|nr:HAD hydrolase family protein [Lentisphaerota bacterium]
MNWLEKCNDIKVVAFDVDGTLTDGSIGYGCGSDDDIKFFNIKDGKAIQICSSLGIKTAAVTGRGGKANQKRLTELKVDLILDKCHNKREGMLQLCEFFEVQPHNCLFVGDDLIDLSAFATCGIAVAVADAAQEVKDYADWILDTPGGRGALRETVEKLLRITGRWEEVMKPYREFFKDKAEK